MNELSREEIQQIVLLTIEASKPNRTTVKEAVRETLTELGIDYSEPLEMQKDFSHLREWRVTTEGMKSKGLLAVFGFLITGILAAAWMGLKTYLHMNQ